MVSDGLFFNAPTRLTDALLTLGAGFQGPQMLAALQAQRQQRQQAQQLSNVVRGTQPLPRGVQGPPQQLSRRQQLGELARLAALETPGAQTFLQNILQGQISPQEERAFGLQERQVRIAEQRLAREEETAKRQQKFKNQFLANLDTGIVDTQTASREQAKNTIKSLQQRKRQLQTGLLDPDLKDFAQSQIDDLDGQIEEARAFEKVRNKAAKRSTSVLTQIDRNLETIERARALVRPGTTGLGSLRAIAPGSPARNLQAELQKLEANLTFEQLQELKELSPTGASGLGPTNELEIRLLGATQENLDQGQSAQQLQAALSRLELIFQESAQLTRSAFEQDFGSPLPVAAPALPQPPPAPGTEQDAAAAPRRRIRFDAQGNRIEQDGR